MKHSTLGVLMLLCSLADAVSPAHVKPVELKKAAVIRVESGERVSENIPEIPAVLIESLQRFVNVRSASPDGWLRDGKGLLVTTRFGDTDQVHWVHVAGGAREQLTFYDEPVNEVVANPRRNGFVFSKDVGGAEFFQLYWFDLDTRAVKPLTDGKSRNESPVWSHDGKQLAYTSTVRNGTDKDIWVLDFDSGKSRLALKNGGTWFATDFSPNGTSLFAEQQVSAAEWHPVEVHLRSGKITPLDQPGRKSAFGPWLFSRDDMGAYYSSDETGEFTELRYRDFASGKTSSLSADIPWDVNDYALSEDGKRVAFLSDEDGNSVLHLLDGATRRPLTAPRLPNGVISDLAFSPDGRQLSFALDSARTPHDIYAVDLVTDQLTRWTRSEAGGLDTSRFIEPTLVRYPTFDPVDGKPRTIPAWYYRPRGKGPFPVVIVIHGGPEFQVLARFSGYIEFMLDELHVAVIMPNVRGSAGYGKTYLTLDDGYKREDAVRDIGALLDWIATQPELDAKRVAVYGASYGGYMALACMTHYNERLRAGIDLVGISNFVTFLEHTESYRRDRRRAEYGDERDPKMRGFLERISPTTNAANITKPLLVAAGANDPRVPPAEGEQIVKAVRANGAGVWYLLQKDEGHGFDKKPNEDHWRAVMMLFLEQNLLGGEAAGSRH